MNPAIHSQIVNFIWGIADDCLRDVYNNPPYGKSWKIDADKMGGKNGIIDSRFIISFEDDKEFSMIPSTVVR